MDVHFKTIKFLKLNWLKNITKSGGAQNEVIKNKAKTDLVVHCHNKDLGRLWCTMNENELLERTDKNHGLYEVITDFPHKVYFDIDKKEKTDETYLNKIIDKINELFPDSNMAISGSVTNDITSYHIVLNDYYIDCEKDRKQMKYIVKYLKIYFDDGFDWKVYTKNRNMKCVNQAKKDGRIQKIILNDDRKMHLITCFVDKGYSIPQFQDAETESMKHIKLKIEVEKSLEPLNLGLLPKLDIKLPKDLDLNNMSNLDLLSIIPLNKSFDHSYTHRIARFCFYNNLTLENFLSWYQQKSTDKDKIKKWQSKWEELKNFPPMSIPAITSILLKYYPDLDREKGYQKFISLFTLDNKNIHKVPTLSQECFNKDDKFICLNTGMGSGKTYQAIEYLKNVESFIWMAPIEALAQNTMHRLEQNKIDCKYYKDFKNSAEKLEK
jgi:hypothetical protein